MNKSYIIILLLLFVLVITNCVTPKECNQYETDFLTCNTQLASSNLLNKEFQDNYNICSENLETCQKGFINLGSNYNSLSTLFNGTAYELIICQKDLTSTIKERDQLKIKLNASILGGIALLIEIILLILSNFVGSIYQKLEKRFSPSTPILIFSVIFLITIIIVLIYINT
ncbi:MAG TPA: hypothetical protein VJB89_03650 [Candidatus Nanoarchaeia archaeon]|nr:hypothetical protein [Candidatus Nanoarchaeia archaeon]